MLDVILDKHSGFTDRDLATCDECVYRSDCVDRYFKSIASFWDYSYKIVKEGTKIDTERVVSENAVISASDPYADGVIMKTCSPIEYSSEILFGACSIFLDTTSNIQDCDAKSLVVSENSFLVDPSLIVTIS